MVVVLCLCGCECCYVCLVVAYCVMLFGLLLPVPARVFACACFLCVCVLCLRCVA